MDRTAFGCTSREEAAASGARWFPYNKGGEFRKWYGNQEHVVNWENDGAEIYDFKPRSVIRNPANLLFTVSVMVRYLSGKPPFRTLPAGVHLRFDGAPRFFTRQVSAKVRDSTLALAEL